MSQSEDKTSRPMTGLWANLTSEQQSIAAAYEGPENHGDKAFLMQNRKRRVWCAKAPDGELRLMLLGATMWLAWGRIQEVSGGGGLDELQKEGWRVVQIDIEEVAS